MGGAHADKEASDERRLLSASREVILWRILLPPPAPNGQSGSYSVGAADGGGFLLFEALAVFPLAGGAPPFYSLAATDHFCYAGDASGTVCVWALPTGEPQPPLVATSRRGGPLRALARTSRMLLCGDGAGGVSVVDAWTERTDGFQASAKGLRAIGATRHEQLFTGGDDRTLTAWAYPTAGGEGVGEPPKVASELGTQVQPGSGRVSGGSGGASSGQLPYVPPPLPGGFADVTTAPEPTTPDAAAGAVRRPSAEERYAAPI